jgi:hypothetical protein
MIVSGLSPDQQHAMLRLLEEALANEVVMKQRIDGLVTQTKSLEIRIVEVKTILQVEQEIPSQIPLRRPVILIDAFEEKMLPFHLDFIDSFEALSAVLLIRFKCKGDDAIYRIRQQLFVLYEHSRQRQIDMNGTCENAFKVIAQHHRERNISADRDSSRDKLSI